MSISCALYEVNTLAQFPEASSKVAVLRLKPLYFRENCQQDFASRKYTELDLKDVEFENRGIKQFRIAYLASLFPGT